MIIKSSLTINELHRIVENLHLASPDEILVAIADAAAERAVRDLMEIDDFEAGY